jgi:C-terminal processing protease CtpA/Prc
MLNECVIDDTLPGSPAHVSQKLKAGDVITAVDGDPVTKDTVLGAIRGRDIPGTSVVITVRSSDQSMKNVILLRQLRSTAFDRRDLIMLLG